VKPLWTSRFPYARAAGHRIPNCFIVLLESSMRFDVGKKYTQKSKKNSTQRSNRLMKILTGAVTLVVQWAIIKIIKLKLEDSFCQLWNTKELSENLSILPPYSRSVCCPAYCSNKTIKFFHSYSNYSNNSHNVSPVMTCFNIVSLNLWHIQNRLVTLP